MAALQARVPPQSIEAEQAVLGSMLLDREAVFAVSEILKEEDFYRDEHRRVFAAIISLVDEGKPVDLVTVTQELQRKGDLERVGGVTYVAGLGDVVPTAANAAYYARLVEEKAVLRFLINAATGIVEQGLLPETDANALLDDAERRIFDISRNHQKRSFTGIREVILETFERLQKLTDSESRLTGVPSFPDLDRLLNGFQRGDLIICAGRPGMGKTSFCLNVAQAAALRSKVTVGIFSLEMSREQLAQRLLAAEAMVDQHRLRTGFLNKDEWSRLVHAAGPLSEAPIFIDDTPAISIGELRAKARRLKAEHDAGLVIIDYLQLIQGMRSESRQQEVAQLSRSLKALARELDIPVMTLSQLNRGVEQRQDKRPVMSDLLESGAIEADADVILFLYRPQYYDPETDRRSVAEVIVAKHRNGPTGTVELVFLPEFTRFVSYTKDPQAKGS